MSACNNPRGPPAGMACNRAGWEAPWLSAVPLRDQRQPRDTRCHMIQTTSRTNSPKTWIITAFLPPRRARSSSSTTGEPFCSPAGSGAGRSGASGSSGEQIGSPRSRPPPSRSFAITCVHGTRSCTEPTPAVSRTTKSVATYRCPPTTACKLPIQAHPLTLQASMAR